MMNIAGIDPGLSGALAILDCYNCKLHLWDTPTITVRVGDRNRKRCDPEGYLYALQQHEIHSAALEKVHSTPNDGHTGAFTFGKTTGITIGLLTALEISFVETTPAKWKHDLRVPADKNAARHRASQIFPNCEQAWARAMDDGRAEAALIALHHAIQSDVLVDNPFTLGLVNGAPLRKRGKA